VLLIGPLMVILEFKVGESHFERSAINQVWDYALDFKYFHESSHNIHVLPVLIATEASPREYTIQQTIHNDGLYLPVCAAAGQVSSLLSDAIATTKATRIDVQRWEQGRYMPTPTIVEAARALYAGHRVEDVSRNDAGARNLAERRTPLTESLKRHANVGKSAFASSRACREPERHW